jgi:hypothetical protein
MCGCRKAGLKCSAACFHCSGETCSNKIEISQLIDENDFEDEPPTMTPLPSPLLSQQFNIEIQEDPDSQPGPSKRLKTQERSHLKIDRGLCLLGIPREKSASRLYS